MKMSWKKSFTVLLLMIILMTSLTACVEMLGTKAKMEKQYKEYLDKKYLEDFKVERLEQYSNENGEAGYRFKVTLKRRPEVTWTLNNVVYDGYLSALWSKDATEDLRPLIEKLYGKVDYEVSIDVSDDSYNELK